MFILEKSFFSETLSKLNIQPIAPPTFDFSSFCSLTRKRKYKIIIIKMTNHTKKYQSDYLNFETTEPLLFPLTYIYSNNIERKISPVAQQQTCTGKTFSLSNFVPSDHISDNRFVSGICKDMSPMIFSYSMSTLSASISQSDGIFEQLKKVILGIILIFRTMCTLNILIFVYVVSFHR